MSDSMLTLLQNTPVFFVAIGGILGLLVGSFSSDITRERVSLH